MSLVGFSGLPAVVTVDVITWVVSEGPFTVQMYMQSTYIIFHTCTTGYAFKVNPDSKYVC